MPLSFPTADDAALIADSIEGRREAFDQLFDRYYNAIHTFAHRLCLNSADADDIAQETFVKAARGLATYRGGDFRSWLLRIAANTFRDQWRAAARRGRMETEAAEALAAEGCAQSTAADRVRDALGTLPEDQRAAVALVYFEGLNHAEAARVLGCAETTVSWRIFRARRQLKQILTEPS